MRWPRRTKAGPAEHTTGPGPASTADPIAAPDAPHIAPPLHIAHPDASHPRADWARLASIVTAAPAPVTFHGEQFGRGVAGARSLTARPHVAHRSGDAPAGVLLDAAHADRIIAPEGPATGAAEHQPVGVHRRAAAATAPPARATTVRTLTGADVEVAFAPATPTSAAAAPDVPTAISWTADGGFAEPAEAPASRMRLVGRRGSVADAIADDGGAVDDAAPVAPGEPTVRFVPAAGPRERLSAPFDVVHAVEIATGVHVGDAVIDRSAGATADAAAMGAIAFARGGVVHLPAELGEISDPGVRAVVAHELTHVAQQRRLAGDVPAEGTATGRALEAQARAVQRSVARGAVAPTFLRDRPSHAEGPLGVQRHANDAGGYTGHDYSHDDLTDADPDASDYPFRWQGRDGEPFGQPWSRREAWARAFEEDQANRLQHLRDQHYQQLAGGRHLSDEEERHVREQLDEAMPYQFGAPSSVDPYPRGGGTAGAAAHTPSSMGGSGFDPDSHAGRLMAQVAEFAIADRANHPIDSLTSMEAITSRISQRHARERDLRHRLLDALVRDARLANEANEAGDVDVHMVALTRDDITQLRSAVDVALPLPGGGAVPYLEDGPGSRTLDGEDGPDLPGATRRPARRAAATAPAPAGPPRAAALTHAPVRGAGDAAAAAPSGSSAASSASTTSSSTASGSSRSSVAAHPPAAPTAPDPGQVELAEIAEESVAQHHDAPAFGSIEALQTYIDARQVLERTLRERLLRAKHEAHPGQLVGLTAQEIQAIRQAVDTQMPLGLDGAAPYLDDDAAASLAADGHTFGGAVPEAMLRTLDQAHARAEARDHHDEHATHDTRTHDAGAHDAHGAHAPDAHAAPAGTAHATPAAHATAVHAALAHDAPHAADEHAALAVSAMTELDLEVLAKRLWGRIRRELRTELLIDRERAGVLADVR